MATCRTIPIILTVAALGAPWTVRLSGRLAL